MPPIMIASEGITSRYTTTIRSPIKEVSHRFASQRIVETRIAATNPKIGAARNTARLPPAGIRVSFPKSLTKSYSGCISGGPTRHCTRAVTLRSTQVENKPTRTVNSMPGKIRKAKMYLVISTSFTPFSFLVKLRQFSAPARGAFF
ncbi:hypothetical protein ES708_34707 [subsurface metagenome]